MRVHKHTDTLLKENTPSEKNKNSNGRKMAYDDVISETLSN